MNRPMVVNIPLPPIQLLLRVFVRVLDTVDLMAQPVDLIEKAGRARSHDFEGRTRNPANQTPPPWTPHTQLPLVQR